MVLLALLALWGANGGWWPFGVLAVALEERILTLSEGRTVCLGHE